VSSNIHEYIHLLANYIIIWFISLNNDDGLWGVNALESMHGEMITNILFLISLYQLVIPRFYNNYCYKQLVTHPPPSYLLADHELIQMSCAS